MAQSSLMNGMLCVWCIHSLNFINIISIHLPSLLQQLIGNFYNSTAPLLPLLLNPIILQTSASKQARKVPVMHLDNSLPFQATFS